MFKPKPRTVIELGPDEYRAPNRLVAPVPDRALPGALFFGGLAILAVDLIAFFGSVPVVLFFAVFVVVPAMAAGWGLGGLLRPYKLVPKPEKVVVVTMEIDDRGGAHEVMPLGSAWAGLLLSVAVVVAIEWYRRTFWQDLLFPRQRSFLYLRASPSPNSSIATVCTNRRV